MILGVHIIRDDLKLSQEEADIIIPYPISEVIADRKTSLRSFANKHIFLFCFALLLYNSLPTHSDTNQITDIILLKGYLRYKTILMRN